ncbi:MAG: M28 family peptidase [Actinobacteria bacterium]|nr:M28 family peptidase [Actinomycetota bacterium]
MNTRTRNRSIYSVLVVGFVITALGAPVSAAPVSDFSRTAGFRKAVTLAGVREHQAAFQSFADDHGGNRVSGGTGGFDDSAEYVHDLMVAAGYDVSYQEFVFTFVGDRTPPVLAQTAPTPTTYVDGVDFGTMSYSGSGDSTAAVTAVDLVLPPVGPGATTSGCEAADFAGFPAGNLALLQRGTCTFRTKAQNAQTAGAAGAIIFNDGGDAGRQGVINGTLSPPPMTNFPVVGTTFALGVDLANGFLSGATGSTARLRVDAIAEQRSTRNVIAETPEGDASRTIVVGAHLDSVTRGAGINDNGSGSAAILEVAQIFAQQDRVARNKIRFMWYGAEEFGLIGSRYYVNSLLGDQLDDIELMLNFDMVGSPNFVRFVYDGDNSAFPVGPGAALGPPGSGAIEAMFHRYFEARGLASAETPFSGRSDYGPFIAAGIPAGGLFTGAEGVKTADQAATYGGTAGQPYDPCYHLACDTYANNSNVALDTNSDAVAHMVLLFSRRKFETDPLVDP